MNRRWTKRVLALSVLFSGASSFGALADGRTAPDNPKFYQPALVTEAPFVVSIIEGLRVTEVRLVNQGTPQAAIEIEVTNDRDLAVMAVDFIWRHGNDSGGVAIDGLLEKDNPRTVVPAHSTESFQWELSGILEGETVFLAAAIFEDGMEVGARQSLAGIRKSRAQYQLEVQARNRRPQ